MFDKRGLARDGDVSAKKSIADTLPSGASPLPHLNCCVAHIPFNCYTLLHSANDKEAVTCQSSQKYPWMGRS